MKRIFAKSTLREYWEKHPDSEQYLKTWYDTIMSSDWKTPNDIKQTYANASILKNRRSVFNIKGKLNFLTFAILPRVPELETIKSPSLSKK